MAGQVVPRPGAWRRSPATPAAVLLRRPTVVLDAVVGGAWALVTMVHTMRGDGYGDGVAMWALMSVAMMLPAALPAAAHVADNSLRWRRRRAVALFVAVYLAVWVAYGAAVLGLASLFGRPSVVAVVAALLVAAAWELGAAKRWALRECHRSVPLAPRGRRATVCVIRFGLHNGGACLASCWALMLVVALVPSHPLLWMTGLTALISAEKLRPRADRTTRIGAVALAGAAVVTLALG